MRKSSPCCIKVGLKKGPWSPEEDQKLLSYIEKYGLGSWRSLPAKAGLQRCGKSCRLRWRNYLRPDIKRGKFSLQEEQIIIQLHALLGNRWSVIANQLPRRTDNEIKNHWNTHLKKRLTKMGIDPVTHKRKSNTIIGSIQSKDAANISHLAQWETARLEAEGRLAPMSFPKVVNHFEIQPQVSLSASAQPLNKTTTQVGLLVVPPCLDVLRASQGTWTKANAFFSPKGSLTYPNSTLHFSDDIFGSSSAGFGTIGLNSQEINCFQKNDLEVEVHASVYHHDFPPHEPIDAGVEINIARSLELPSFMEAFAGSSCSWPSKDNGQQWINQGAGPCDDLNCDERSSCGEIDLEDNQNHYWNHVLNSVTFT